MVARTPPKQRKMVAPLNPTLLRETVNKVDKCMARLQELQYTVAGGKKVISGVNLSPRSTRGYMRTSLRCKQESLRIKSGNHTRKSPPGKLPTNTGEWRRMSLPAMLVGETIGEILQASQFAREIVASVHSKTKKPPSDDPKTPVMQRRKQRPNPENSELHSRRKREKQAKSQSTRPESQSPSLHRARSRINFKPCERESTSYIANRVSPRNRPWAKKTVLFPNPLFHSSPTSNHHKFFRTNSPVIAGNRKTPHKFLIKTKSPPPPPRYAPAKFSVKIRSPPRPLSLSSPARPTKSPKMAKLRRSFSPSRIANRLVSPLKNRKSVMKSDGGGGGMVSGLKQRPISTPMQLSARRL
ncbi:Microtubule-binding protein like [Actinidia chinensis var. chinensis]|uniref:Microtubule-binding protein like n=1 Tax=Actinidia chinensis var. chinensis TaxID=1590841 RepID=A0A2R6RD85_ACTCC|nr:Microtubule-binding protein like [Actinidia chinensis var. chinensis]